MSSTFADSEFREIPHGLIDVTTWNPARVYGLLALAEVSHDMTRGFDVTHSDIELMLVFEGTPHACHVVHHFKLPDRVLAFSFNIDDDTVMTVLALANMVPVSRSDEEANKVEEWFFSTWALVLPSRDLEEWGEAGSLDTDQEVQMSRQRAARILDFAAHVLANEWISEIPISPIVPPAPGMP